MQPVCRQAGVGEIIRLILWTNPSCAIVEILRDNCGYLDSAPMTALRWKIAQWLELNWWKAYLRNKNKEEYFKWKRKYWANILAELKGHIAIDSCKTICDLGCGPTGIFIALPENKITAVDPLLYKYEQDIPFFNPLDYPNTSFVQYSIEDFTAFEFDVVFCMNAINHVQDIEKAFDKLVALCADKGAIVLSIDAHNFSFFKYLARILPIDILHPHQFDLDEYYSFLENREIKIVKTQLLKKGFFFNHFLLVIIL